MASSNRHWPSMFKSKPCNRHEYNSPHYSATCKSLPLPSSGGGAEERSPEPKPRWNPKPEQIRILEAIFNSGMVNPPRDEIKKIRAQLQEYGQVGDANVFYWFQNRKSRSKQKNRQLLHNVAKSTAVASKTPPGVHVVPPSSTSSSSSDISSPKNVLELSNSPTGSVSRTFFHHHGDSFLHQELPAPAPLPYFFPVQQNAPFSGGQTGLSFNDMISGGAGGGRSSTCTSQVVHPLVEPATTGTFSGLLLGEMIGGGVGGDELKRSSTLEDEEKLRLEQELSFLVTNPSPTNTIVPPTSAASLIFPSLSDVRGAGEGGMVGPAPAKSSTVFINEVAFEVPAEAPFNVREVFGDDAVLVHQTGHPVATTEWGLTIDPLQHGAFYFLARTLASPAALEKHDAAPYLLPPPEFPFNYKI